MQISRSSWHYKMYRYVKSVSEASSPRDLVPFAGGLRIDPKPPKNLCPYTWTLIFGCVGMAVFMAVFGILALVFWIIDASVAGYKALDGSLTRLDSWAFAWKRKLPAIPGEPPFQRKPSVIAAFFRARKDNVCPTVELVD